MVKDKIIEFLTSLIMVVTFIAFSMIFLLGIYNFFIIGKFFTGVMGLGIGGLLLSFWLLTLIEIKTKRFTHHDSQLRKN